MKNFYVLLFCLFGISGFAQQLDKIGKKDGIKVSGGVGLSNNFYFSDGISRLNPYYYVLTGNVNVSLYGFSLPFSFAFSNQNFTYRQPFNILGVSPTYKKYTFHAGYRNLAFSPYTLNGHTFLGGGMEYRGETLSISTMAGRLLRAVEYDSTNNAIPPAFERWGGGAKVSYRFDQDEIFASVFYAKDMQRSLDSVPSFVGLNPQENQVYSIGGKKLLYKKLMLQGEIARSAWTSDVNTEAAQKGGDVLANLYFIPWRQSTLVYNAFKANATYNFTFMNLGVGYERVDPEYRTLGAYFFNNDLENVTLNFSTSLFKKKVNLTANGGLQRDDLNNTKASSMNRKVASVNVSATPTSRINLAFSYSNFNSYMNIKPVDVRFLQNTPYSEIDTLNFTQISQTINGTVSYKLLESDYESRNISVNTSMMKASNKQGNNSTVNEMINGAVVFSQMWKKSGINVGINANGNQTSFAAGDNVFAGLGVNAGLPVFQKKVRISLSANVNQNYERGNLVARLYSVTNSYALRVAKKHAFNANLRYTGRSKIGEANLGRYNTAFNELIASVGYNYSF